MKKSGFHTKPFEEGTVTKLRIFELYAREWLPVFLAKQRPLFSEIHIYDFFAGPGMDSEGTLGSPLRILEQLVSYRDLPGWTSVRKKVHFSDSSSIAISRLRKNMAAYETALRNVSFQVEATEFKDAFAAARPTLLNTEAAKLVFADQFGVGQVTDEIFQTLVAAPACDFLFFISSSTLHRFADHPAIKQKIKRPNDYYHVHNAVLAYYRQLLSDETDYYLAPFSIKKGANIYGIIFGSAHLRGIDKFLNVAWKEDQFSGAADFDIDRANIRRDELLLDLAPFKPTKVQAFENDLENEILAGRVSDEVDVMRICFEHGVKRQHAKHILAKLKTEGKMSADFQVPDVARLKDPRPIRLLPGDD